MRASEDSAPKPMTTIGERPVLWHVMRYYAYFGHTDFILCLGHGARAVKDYFLRYDETASNDFTLSKGGSEIDLYGCDIADWRITFVDTGIETAIGERLRRVRKYLDDDDVFLANYGDVLTDAPMNEIIDQTLASDVVGSLLAVKPQDSFHVVGWMPTRRSAASQPAADMNLRINGGYFVLRNEIFDYLNEGEDLVMDACRRAADVGKMLAIPYDGFWAPMDTLKERNALEVRHQTGNTPWMLWRKAGKPHAIVPTIDVPDVAL